MDEFFAWERKKTRLAVLEDASDKDVLMLKRELLARLRQQDVYVLERGAIEEYYPPGITGPDKPTRAQAFCSVVTSREAALALSDLVEEPRGRARELELILAGVYGDAIVFEPITPTQAPVPPMVEASGSGTRGGVQLDLLH